MWFALVIGLESSWAGPPNPTDSDGHRNTAGGYRALINLDAGDNAAGFDNTVFGYTTLADGTIYGVSEGERRSLAAHPCGV